MLLSVLILVYNVASYLERCVNSLLLMPLEPYEIILVDDGSTDPSGELCDELRKRNRYIKVIHQSHQGLVAARNAALAAATGRYISFVDSDDWVDHELLPSLVSDLESQSDVDIAVGRTVRSRNENSSMTYLTRTSGKLDRDQAIKAMVNKDGMHWYLWGKVYRRSLFEDLIADTSVTVFEDLDRIWPVAMRARKFFFDDKYAYHYFMNLEGMTKKRCDLNPSSWRVFQRILLDKKAVECVRQEMANFYVQVFLRHTLEMYFVDREGYRYEIRQYVQELQDTLHEAGAEQTIISNEEYRIISSGCDGCIRDYDSVFRKLKTLLRGLSESYSSIYVYGTGIIAQYLAAIMEEMDIRPSAFVVSDGQARTCEFMGRPVLYLSEIQKNAEIAFVLALSGTARQSVLDILRDHSGASFDMSTQVIPIEFPPILF